MTRTATAAAKFAAEADLTRAERVAADAYALALTSASDDQLAAYGEHHARGRDGEAAGAGARYVHDVLLALVEVEQAARDAHPHPCTCGCHLGPA